LQFAPENWLVADRSSMYFDEPSLYYIKAIEPSKVVFLHPKFFSEAAKIRFEFSRFTETSLQRNVYFLQRRIQSLLAMTARERYQQLMALYPGPVLLVRQCIIDAYLDMTPQRLSRVRREIEKQHV